MFAGTGPAGNSRIHDATVHGHTALATSSRTDQFDEGNRRNRSDRPKIQAEMEACRSYSLTNLAGTFSSSELVTLISFIYRHPPEGLEL
jgi:hypothetical protein